MGQRGSSKERRVRRAPGWVLRKGRATGPQPSRPAIKPLRMPYRVHMRNTSAMGRGTWAAYVLTARERAGLNKSELGRRIGRDRATVARWEDGKHRPEDADLVARVAVALGLDIDEALAAAGMRPGVQPPAEPTQDLDEETDLILRSNVSPDMKRVMLQRLEDLRERDKQRRMEDLRFMLERST